MSSLLSLRIAVALLLFAAPVFAAPKQQPRVRPGQSQPGFIRAAGSRGLLPRTIKSLRVRDTGRLNSAVGPAQNLASPDSIESALSAESEPLGKKDQPATQSPSTGVQAFVDVVQPKGQPSEAGLRRAYEAGKQSGDSNSDTLAPAVNEPASGGKALPALSPAKKNEVPAHEAPVPSPKSGKQPSAAEIRRLTWFFILTYGMQGIRGILGIPLGNLIFQSGYTQLESSILTAGLILPWTIKPLYGWLSDFVPVLGMRRKFWLSAGALLTSVSYGWIASPLLASMLGLAAPAAAPVTAALIVGVLLWANFGVATNDVSADALLVENGKRLKKIDDFQNYSYRANYIATFIATGLGTTFAYLYDPLFAVQLSSAFIMIAPLIVLVYGLFAVKEAPASFRFRKLSLAPRIMWENLLNFGGWHWSKTTDFIRLASLIAAAGLILSSPTLAGPLLAAGAARLIWANFGSAGLWSRLANGAKSAGSSLFKSLAAMNPLKVFTHAFWTRAVVGEAGPDAPKSERADSSRERRMRIAQAFVGIAAFTAFWDFMPGAGTPLYYFKRSVLEFDVSFFGIAGMVGSAAAFLGTIVHKRYFRDRFTTSQLLRMSMWIMMALSLKNLLFVAAGSLGLGHEVTYPMQIGMTLIGSIVGTIPFLIGMKLLAVVTPAKIAGTAFAAMASVSNLFSNLSDVFGSWMFQIVLGKSLTALIILSSLMGLFPLFAIRFLPAAINSEPPQGTSATIRGDLKQLAAWLTGPFRARP